MNSERAARTAYLGAMAAYRTMRNQCGRMSDELTELTEHTMPTLGREWVSCEENLSEVLASHAGGTATELDVQQAREQVAAAKARADEATRKAQAIRGQVPKLNAELHRLKLEAAQAREKLAEALWNPIEKRLKADKKLRRALVEIHALTDAARSLEVGTSGLVASWDGLLADLFPEPDAEEFMPVYEEVLRHFEPKESEAA